MLSRGSDDCVAGDALRSDIAVDMTGALLLECGPHSNLIPVCRLGPCMQRTE